MDQGFGEAAKAWPTTSRGRLRRYPARGSYEQPGIYKSLDAALLCHVAYCIEGQPYCTPTAFWRDGDRLFWHGSSASRMLRTLAHQTPACVTVSHCDGIVLARSAFHHSINYRSVMAFGNAEIVAGEDAKIEAARMFVNRYFPGRWNSIKRPSAQEMKASTFVTMRIEEASAKTRTGPPVDDEADYALPIWAGVVPLRTVVGAPLDCPRQHADAHRGTDLSYWRDGRVLGEVLAETSASGTS